MKKVIVQKRSNVGSESPIVARLIIQTMDFVPALCRDEPGQIVKLYASLVPKLVACYEAERRSFDNLTQAFVAARASVEAGSVSLPYQIGLEQEATAFLMLAKQYIRDLVPLINCLFESGLSNNALDIAHPNPRKRSAFQNWAANAHPARPDFLRWLDQHVAWISELSRKRNAVEHEGGDSGVIHFQNYSVSPEGSLVPPRWWREGKGEVVPNPTDVAHDLEDYVELMLRFSEELLLWAVELGPVGATLSFDEIAPEARNPACPKRFKASLVVPT